MARRKTVLYAARPGEPYILVLSAISHRLSPNLRKERKDNRSLEEYILPNAFFRGRCSGLSDAYSSATDDPHSQAERPGIISVQDDRLHRPLGMVFGHLFRYDIMPVPLFTDGTHSYSLHGCAGLTPWRGSVHLGPRPPLGTRRRRGSACPTAAYPVLPYFRCQLAIVRGVSLTCLLPRKSMFMSSHVRGRSSIHRSGTLASVCIPGPLTSTRSRSPGT